MVSKSLVRRAAPLLKMYRMTRQASASPARAQDSRSPFVRLRELLGDMPPGNPAISMAVGEPQHPMPPFVGPVIAAHIDEFGRYPMNKGLDAFGEAVAKWLNRRYALERPVDPSTEVLVLNGTREGLFLAALAAKNWVKPRAGPAGRAHPQSVLCGLFGGRDRGRLRAGLFASDRRDRLSARSRRVE